MLSSLTAYQRVPSQQASVWYMGSLMTFLADTKDTGGGFSLCEVLMKPGNEPPPHVHEREDELFYILDGEIDAYAGADVFHLKAGGCMFLPRLQPHSFIIRSLRFRMLILTQPGGLEGYFRSMATSPAYELDLPREAVTYSTADIEHAMRTAGDFGIRFLSPDQVRDQMPIYFADLQIASVD